MLCSVIEKVVYDKNSQEKNLKWTMLFLSNEAINHIHQHIVLLSLTLQYKNQYSEQHALCNVYLPRLNYVIKYTIKSAAVWL